MKEIFAATIPSDIMDYLQYLNMEIENYELIMKDVLLKHPSYSYNTENYSHFMGEFRDFNMKYNLYTQDILYNHAPEYAGSEEHEVTFDFNTKRMIITEKGEGGSCNVCRI